jgi:hypothetical protein
VYRRAQTQSAASVASLSQVAIDQVIHVASALRWGLDIVSPADVLKHEPATPPRCGVSPPLPLFDQPPSGEQNVLHVLIRPIFEGSVDGIQEHLFHFARDAPLTLGLEQCLNERAGVAVASRATRSSRNALSDSGRLRSIVLILAVFASGTGSVIMPNGRAYTD